MVAVTVLLAEGDEMKRVSRSEHAPPSRQVWSDLAFAAVLIIFQVALFLLMWAATGDPFDSPVYWYSWLLLPAFAFMASYARPRGARPLLWTSALIVPFMVEGALLNTVWRDPGPDDGLWIIGEMLLLVLGGVTFVAATGGAWAGLSHRAR